MKYRFLVAPLVALLLLGGAWSHASTQPLHHADPTAIRQQTVTFGTLRIDGLDIAYREAGDPSKPKLVLLHGWPSSSHQYRNLIPALATRFHVIAPDYPGFGNSSIPDPATYTYSFDGISRVIEHFLAAKSFTRFGLYMQDYGGPVGFRMITRNPDRLEWLIIQNANAYDVGFTPAWDGLRYALWTDRSRANEIPLEAEFTRDAIRSYYLAGASDPALISPDNWASDFGFLQRPNALRLNLDLFYDYRTNVALYPQWQQFLREQQPRALIFWGQGDIFFSPEGGEAYLLDLPEAEMHRLAAGHFAVEDHGDYIAESMIRFYDARVAQQ